MPVTLLRCVIGLRLDRLPNPKFGCWCGGPQHPPPHRGPYPPFYIARRMPLLEIDACRSASRYPTSPSPSNNLLRNTGLSENGFGVHGTVGKHRPPPRPQIAYCTVVFCQQRTQRMLLHSRALPKSGGERDEGPLWANKRRTSTPDEASPVFVSTA